MDPSQFHQFLFQTNFLQKIQIVFPARAFSHHYPNFDTLPIKTEEHYFVETFHFKSLSLSAIRLMCWLLSTKDTFLQKSKDQGCQIFLGPNIPKCTKYTKLPQTTYTKRLYIIPKGRKLFQMVIKYNNIFHSKALQTLPKLGFLVWKQTIWQPWVRLPPRKCKDKIFHALYLSIYILRPWEWINLDNYVRITF
jgi:hypothetical protein